MNLPASRYIVYFWLINDLPIDLSTMMFRRFFLQQGPFPVLIGFIFLLISSNLNWGKQIHINRIIKSDGKGYYAYLPAIFIYQDLNFNFYDKMDMGTYFDAPNQYDYRTDYKGKKLNKYYLGTALAMAPFFGMAHCITKINGGEADGYSTWYQLGISLAAIFWLVVGLHFLNSLLRMFYVDMLNRIWVLLVTSFGTHLFYYVLVEPSMSHVYSFAFVTAFLYYSILYFEKPNIRTAFILSLLLGMIGLIRPVNLLVVIILPFLAGDVFKFFHGLKWLLAHPIKFFLLLVSFLSVLFLQSLVYKFSVGTFFVYAYGQEGFLFCEPHFFDFLFSYRKGFFLYTPIFLISLFGLFYLAKESFYKVWTWLLFFIPAVYIISSWWIWYYGGSFSARVMVEFIPVFMILLGILFQKIHFRIKPFFLFGVFLIVLLCQLQTYQYRYYQIHWSEMNKEKYWDVFLRLDKIGKEP